MYIQKIKKIKIQLRGQGMAPLKNRQNISADFVVHIKAHTELVLGRYVGSYQD